MVDPELIEVIKNNVWSVGGVGLSAIIVYLLIKKSLNGGSNGAKDLVSEKTCLERNKRVGDEINSLKKNDDLHFEAQKENITLLHSMDKNLGILIDQHEKK